MKRNISLLLISIHIMLGLPLLTVTFSPHDTGMMICFLLFFAVNPLYSMLVGIASGKQIRKTWFQPILTPLLFLTGTWLFFDERETAFLGYAGFYMVIGITSMVITAFVKKIKE